MLMMLALGCPMLELGISRNPAVGAKCCNKAFDGPS